MKTLAFFFSSILLSALAFGSTVCTESTFQTLLDGMASTGKFMEVFPVNVPEFPTAFKQVQHIPFKEVYVLTKKLADSTMNLPDSIYTTTYINGVTLQALWNQLEPSAGTYDFSVVDAELNRAVLNHKKITVTVDAGVYTPTWLYGPPYNVPHGAFQWSNHNGANGACDAITLPVFWSPAYEQAFGAMMAALAAHMKTTSAYGQTTRVKLTGINTLTDELHLAYCDNTGGEQTWAALGYTPDKAIAAAQALAASTNAAFPNKLLDQAIIEAGGMPPINNAGQIIAKKDPTYVNVKQKIVDALIATYPGRAGVQWNGFQSVATAAPSVLNDATKGAIIGWETNEFGGNSAGAECP